MRELTVNEIAQLEERGCWAEDWSDILVEEGFAPSQMENVLLYGHVEVGSLNGSVEMEEGFRRRCCLRNAVLRNVTVGDDCLLLVCLAADITPEDVEAMAEYVPAKVIISRDSFDSDTAMANAYYILRDRGIELKLL